ncbi:MAG: hypothetical protein KBE09_03855 [Candidatus Pacebacteria bacterium]|nr:hypothetical protein [Candidatus Paceibacterota bacterium]
MPKMLIGFVAAGVLILGAWWFMSNQANPTTDTNTPPMNDAAAAPSEAPSGAFTGSFEDLATRGGNWMCTFTSKTDMGDATGTVYVSGTRVRGNFAITAPVIGKVDSYMIADDEYTYSWSSVMPQGFKARRVDTAQQPDGTTPTADTGVDPRMSMNYNCEPHQADESLFTVPTNVTFQTLN